MNMIAQKPYLTAAELAKVLQISVRTVYSLNRLGMPHFNAGIPTGSVQRSAPRYELEKMQAWLESRMKKGGTDK